MSVNLFELLQDPDDGVPHLCQGELLPNAYAGTTIEWDVLPWFGLPSVPAIRAEDVSGSKCGRGWGVDRRVTLHV